jgi:hypothetical protein
VNASAPARQGWLEAAAFVAVLTIAIIGGLVWAAGEPLRMQAVAVAAVASGTAAFGGWCASRWGRGRAPAQAVSAGLATTVARLAPTLAALAWVTNRPDLRRSGAGGLLVIFYLALLATDLLLHIRLAAASMTAVEGGSKDREPTAN